MGKEACISGILTLNCLSPGNCASFDLSIPPASSASSSSLTILCAKGPATQLEGSTTPFIVVSPSSLNTMPMNGPVPSKVFAEKIWWWLL